MQTNMKYLELLLKPAILLAITIQLLCTGGQKTQEKTIDGSYIHVNAVGSTLETAEIRAQKLIIEKGLGSYINSIDIVVDAQMQASVINSTTEGFIYDFAILEKQHKKDRWEIQARGRVSQKAVGNALLQAYNAFGKPRLMLLLTEKIQDETPKPDNSISEYALVSQFKDFTFVDRRQLQRLLRQENGLAVAAYTDPAAHEKALQVAADLNAEILLVGETEISVGKAIIEDLHPVHAVVRIKIINVGTAQILAAEESTGTHPHIDLRQGAQKAIGKAVKSIHPKILAQIETKWTPGITVRVVFENISYDEFLDRGVLDAMQLLPGVNVVHDRGVQENGRIVLEVTALMNGNRLYRQMRDVQKKLGLTFRSRVVQNNRVHVTVGKR